MTIIRLANYGLCNQLFAYVYARYLADKCDDKLYLYSPGRSAHGYDYFEGLGRFMLRIDKRINVLQLTFYSRGRNVLHAIYLFRERIIRQEKRANREIERKYGKTLSKKGIIINYNVDNWMDYMEEPHSVNYICGFFQFKKYAYLLRDELCQMMRFKEKEIPRFQKLISLMSETDSVCIHIRRGDYIDNSDMILCSDDYYCHAMESMCRRFGDPLFFVFSDDWKYVKHNYRFGNRHVCFVAEHLPIGAGAPDEVRLMGYCNHYIISNSSFSWWGQFLGNHEEKHVIAPDRWFKDEDMKCFLYEEQWEIIPA